MFSKQITTSDAFVDMPISSQLLYFHLNMEADDDGFVSNPKRITRMIGANDDDLKILLAKRFLLAFENGVVVIKHWLLHNAVRKDMYVETQYLEQKNMLQIKDNKVYTEVRNESVTSPLHRLDKVRLDKVREIHCDASVTDDVQIIPEKSERTPRKKKDYDDTTPFILEQFAESMEASPQRHIRIVGMYAATKELKYSTKGQWKVFTDRNLKAARRLSPYTDDQIGKAFTHIKENTKSPQNPKGYITRWTLETLEKYLEEN